MRKVMLVEDEEFILQGLQSIIDWDAIGMRVVHTAHNGKEALEKWKEESVDIIVTDINMPVMDGLEFLRELRCIEQRARTVILTGYDEFDYARKAITLDVEDYILKPIDEKQLEEVLCRADAVLRERDHKQAVDMDGDAGWIQFLRGNLTTEEAAAYAAILPVLSGSLETYTALMKLDMESLKNAKLSDVLLEFQEQEDIRIIYLAAGCLLILLYGRKTEEDCIIRLTAIQNQIESRYGILSFISIGAAFQEYKHLPRSYESACQLQKYQVIEGYGGCISQSQVSERRSEDISIDSTQLRKMILKKDKDGAIGYLEDLFINNIRKDSTMDDVYKMCIQTAMLLHEIKEEYKLQNRKNMQNLTGLISQIYQAEDLFSIKTIFISEITEIITYLHEEDSQYTPVIKQIISEVQKNYQDDMNLKTLSYKYNMNASYLGTIFQKEVGCTFAQYLSNTKNSIAKDLILNTNMRINDIAKTVGYPDTSYFYRKFKQCYGVSPASLREMKKY